MNVLRLDRLGAKAQRILSLSLVAAMILTAVAFAFVPPVAANTCSGWTDTSVCCTAGWPSWSRDERYRWCAYCSPAGCIPWKEYICEYWSVCP